MATSRDLYLVSTAGVAFVAGILIGCVTTTQVATLHHIVVSGDPPAARPDPETIHAGNGDIVNWTSDPSLKLGILFKAADFDPNSSTNALKEPPFAGGTPGMDQVINCAGSSCTSLNINPKLVAYLHDNPTAHFDYKYWQSLNEKSKDGHIIIKW